MNKARTSPQEAEEKSIADAVLDISWSQSIGLAVLLTIALIFAHAAAQKAGSLLFGTSCAAAVIALAGAAVLREKLLFYAVLQGLIIWLLFGSSVLISEAGPADSGRSMDRLLAWLEDGFAAIPYISTGILVVAAAVSLAIMGRRAFGLMRK